MAQLQKAAFAVFLAHMEEDLCPVTAGSFEALGNLVEVVAMITTVHQVCRIDDCRTRLHRIGLAHCNERRLKVTKRLRSTTRTIKLVHNEQQLKRWCAGP